MSDNVSLLTDTTLMLFMFVCESQQTAILLRLIVTAMNTTNGSTTLRDIACVYEITGRFLSDLNLLSEVHFNSYQCYILT